MVDRHLSQQAERRGASMALRRVALATAKMLIAISAMLALQAAARATADYLILPYWYGIWPR